MRDLQDIKTFAIDDVFHIVVESPRGAAVKLKYSPELGAMSISRPLALGLTYPCDWGFVPSTEGPEGDPIVAAPVESRRDVPLTGRIRRELEQFFIAATALENKDPRIVGWDGPDAAIALIRQSAT